ncbi:MAG: DUF3892 domain-containing protein [Chloroflexi bacterium]|nr:DUF3892 domain-containing protein [Chloroflexota bacterium]MYD66415.1 DUF3892 domain-containing protein [Chloroflexota bacterium]
MAERAVTRTRKDSDGDILALCNGSAVWSPRPKHLVITDIETGLHSYHVPWTDGSRTRIYVVNGVRDKYLRTDHDSTTRNNLDDLPDC